MESELPRSRILSVKTTTKRMKRPSDVLYSQAKLHSTDETCAGAFCNFLAAKKLECKDYKKNKRQQLKVENCRRIQANNSSDTVVAMPFLYCTIKLLACICSQVVFFRTLPLAPSGGDRWFYADRKYQRPLRMVAFLTQSVVDVFGVLRN